ncbi:MAG: type restriction enzyme protein [Solirubrobacteraceae bacterium]|nr:type restriction enzyme protein [Solirubrobacteraceae bacterium]
MFYGAGIPAVYLVVNKVKPASRKRKVLFVNASDCFERRDTKNLLRQQDVERISAAFHDEEPQEGFSIYATRDEVVTNDYNLTVRRYVGSVEGNGEVLSFDDAAAAYREAQKARAAAEKRLGVLLALIEHEADE